MRKGLLNIILGVMFGFSGLMGLLSVQEISIPYIYLGFYLVLNGVFQNKGYYNKTYFMTQFSIIIIFGIIFAYIYLFIPEFFGNKIFFIYLTFASLIGMLILLIYEFYHRENNQVFLEK
jgi:hypothetical protein